MTSSALRPSRSLVNRAATAETAAALLLPSLSSAVTSALASAALASANAHSESAAETAPARSAEGLPGTR